jgi:biotin synthase-like enzyme
MSDQKKLDELKAEMALLEAPKDRYFELSRQAYDLSEKIRKSANLNNLANLERECWFEECQYPAMGVEQKNGYASFKTEEQASALIEALRKMGSYYYAYILHWEGPGDYDVIPDYRRDHDGETVYTANFVKQVSDED